MIIKFCKRMFTKLVAGIAMRLLLSLRSIAMTSLGLLSRTQYELSSRTQCGDLGFCHYERSEVIQKSSVACEEIASTTPQVWLVAGLHLGFAKKSFHSIASDKVLGQEMRGSRLPRRVFYTSRNDKNRAARFAMTRFAGKCRNKCVRDGKPVRVRTRGIFLGTFLGSEAERTSAA